MLNFNNIRAEDLARIGIVFATKEETESFIDLIRGVVEVRIGEEISKGVSREKLAEFDRCSTTMESVKWLRENRPDYNDVVIRTSRELEHEIISHKEDIEGNIYNSQIETFME